MKKILIANWKMNPTSTKDAKTLFQGYIKNTPSFRGVDVVVCPPAYFLRSLREQYKGKGVLFGGQTISEYESGSRTGETSLPMLLDSKCSHVILGHSEQRNVGETNQGVNKKIKLSLKSKVTPVACIGESVRKEDAEYLFFIKKQVTEIFKGLTSAQAKKVIVAYEPIWAIGAKEPMQGHEMHQMVLFIRKVLIKLYSANTAKDVAIIYGGSINESNVSDMNKNGFVDGLIIGRASLDPDQVAALAKAFK
jgi:triosephosphate isomerase